MTRYFKIILLTGITFTSSFFSGCIDDDYDDCVQGIDVSFYSKTVCLIDTLYPESISNMTLCVFDENGTLVTHQNNSDIKLQKSYSQRLEVVNSGLYTVVAWAGLNSSLFDISTLQDGITKKSDLLFRLKQNLGHVEHPDENKIYYGESPVVYVPRADDSQSIFENTAVNMLEVTNRITVIIEGLTNPEEYTAEIESDNGSMNINRTIAGDQIINYDSELIEKDGVAEAYFTTLKLETGRINTLVIRSKADNRELYRGNLLDALLLKNPDINLECDHDFTIKFTIEDLCDGCGTYTIMKIWVNNWLVHSYDTVM